MATKEPKILRIRLREAGQIGDEVLQYIGHDSRINSHPITLHFDADERFIRVESAQGWKELIPVANIASMRIG